MTQIVIHMVLTNIKGEKHKTRLAIQRGEGEDHFDLSNVHSVFGEDAITIALQDANWRRSQLSHVRILAA